MPITVNIYYTGQSGSARAFAQEMLDAGVVTDIRAEEGNLRYEYFLPLEDPETILLIDRSFMFRHGLLLFPFVGLN